MLIALAADVHAAEPAPSRTALERGIALRSQGQLSLSITELRRACDAAPDPAAKMRATGELGVSLLQARQLDPAAESLQQAYAFYQGREKARLALDLGNLSALKGQPDEARRFYDEAVQLAAGDVQISYPARLNRARLGSPIERLSELDSLARGVAKQPDNAARMRWQINLGQQYNAAGQAGLSRAYEHLSGARASTAAAQEPVLLAEALDAMAQLYEDQGRIDEAIRLNRQGLAATDGVAAGVLGDRRIQLEWRSARLSRNQGSAEAALAAYQRAVQRIETVRQDLPIEDENGRSSFETTLHPIYLGLIDALLTAVDRQPAEQASASLRQVVDTVELLRQSELQDYLGDRCEVDAIKGGSTTVLPNGTAVLYPIVLDDRLELLLETNAGITRYRSAVDANQLREVATRFAGHLRSGAPDYLGEARQLYDWVLRPLEAGLAAQGVKTLVLVPDGSLRLVAMGAFHDGKQFAIEKYAMATATGMSMTNTASDTPIDGVLLAGLSTPGPVVDKLGGSALTQLLGPQVAREFAKPAVATSRSVRSLRGLESRVEQASAQSNSRSVALRDALSLPGVGKEVAAIGRVAGATQLLNDEFTVENFRREAESGRYSVIHLASHGVFGGRGDATFLLAYDELLTLDRLQLLLRSDAFRRKPIELLSLSACETAEGDERSPLGISGAAIKARARAVMGSLWPVSDDAAVDLMERFYSGLLSERLPKAEALQASQVAMLRKPEFAHPFFWAPFILIGNWF